MDTNGAMSMIEPRVISEAWPDILSEFIGSTCSEVLLMSPWITTGVAKLISNSISRTSPIKLQILARLDESDFLSGTSHIEAFRAETYPSNSRLEVRALPMLHGKMLISDREKVLVGSANMTDGGLFRNHEICLLLNSRQIGEECGESFFKYWAMGQILPRDYLDNLETILEESLPSAEEEDSHPAVHTEGFQRKPRRKRSPFKYTSPSGARSARSFLADML